jgi:hypothetical protein
VISGPLMVLVVALLVDATIGPLPAPLNPAVWMEKLSARLGRLAPFLVPPAFTAAAVLLGWVNAPDPLVMVISVWLLASCLILPESGASEPLAARFVAPLFYYALFGVPGAVLSRAVLAAGGPIGLDRVVAVIPRWLAAGALALAGRLRGRVPSTRQSAPAPIELDEVRRTTRMAAWIAAAAAALSLYPRHAFLL